MPQTPPTKEWPSCGGQADRRRIPERVWTPRHLRRRGGFAASVLRPNAPLHSASPHLHAANTSTPKAAILRIAVPELDPTMARGFADDWVCAAALLCEKSPHFCLCGVPDAALAIAARVVLVRPGVPRTKGRLRKSLTAGGHASRAPLDARGGP